MKSRESRQSEAASRIDLVFPVDTATIEQIRRSGKDPRDRNNWEVIAAADGNKGRRIWRG